MMRASDMEFETGLRSSSESLPDIKYLIEEYKDDCERRGLTRETIRRYLSSIGIFVQYLEENELDLITSDRDILRGFLDYLRRDRKIKQRTVENYFAALSSFYEFLEYERYIGKNPVQSIRKRYIRRFKDNDEGQMRKLISVEEMTHLINSTMDVRDRAVITLLAKTGIRRRELITLMLTTSTGWSRASGSSQPPRGRNRIVFFDDETAFILKRWLRSRESRNGGKSKALFINSTGGRLNRNGVYTAVIKAAEFVGLA
jgi:integrase/recombinase XerD